MHSCVILKNEDQLQFAPIGQALADYRGVPVLDTVNEAKKCWGIIAEKTDEKIAKQLIETLAKFNLSGVSIEQESLRNLAPALAIESVDAFKDGFRLGGEDGSVHDLKNQDMRVIGAAAFKSTTQKKIEEKQGPTTIQKAASVGLMLATGLPISIGPKKKNGSENCFGHGASICDGYCGGKSGTAISN